MASAPTSATRRFKVAVSRRGAGRERSVSDSCAGASRTGRARNVSASTTPRGGRASSASRSSPPTESGSVMGTAGVSAPSWTRPAPRRGSQIRGTAAPPDDRHPPAEARRGERGDAALRDPHADLHVYRRGGVAEPRGQARLVAEEPFEPGGVEIDPAGAGVLHSGGMSERHLEQRGPRRVVPRGFIPRGFIYRQPADDAGPTGQSSVQDPPSPCPLLPRGERV